MDFGRNKRNGYNILLGNTLRNNFDDQVSGGERPKGDGINWSF
jgi:hypothetical protein